MEDMPQEAWPRVRRWLIAASILMATCLAAIFIFNQPARAMQLQCGPLPLLLKQLVDRYHEFVALTANNADGNQVVVTLSQSGTFTVLVSDGKRACVVLAGDKAELDKGI